MNVIFALSQKYLISNQARVVYTILGICYLKDTSPFRHLWSVWSESAHAKHNPPYISLSSSCRVRRMLLNRVRAKQSPSELTWRKQSMSIKV